MENKQLFEKQGNGYNPFFPIVRLEDIIETITDKSIQWIFNNYNHIYVEYSESTAITRNKVPTLLRRSGLWISYNNGKEIITEYYKGSNNDVQNYTQWTIDDNWEQFNKIKHLDGSITYQHLSEALKELIRNSNTITNFPDDEDLEVRKGVLKFKDKEYDTDNFSGLGRVILRKNLKTIDNEVKNVLTQSMINKLNTIYIIQYDYDLRGETINIPEGCVLDFKGGSLNNGKVAGLGSVKSDDIGIFKNVEFKNSTTKDIHSEWFGLNVENGTNKNSEMRNLFSMVNKGCTIYFNNSEFMVSDTEKYDILYDNVTIIGLNVNAKDEQGVRSDALISIKANNVTIKDCCFTNGIQIIYLHNCNNILVDNCVFDSTGYSIIQKVGTISDNVTISNCVCKNALFDFIEANCTSSAPSRNWKVINNVFEGCKNYPTKATESRFVGFTAVSNILISGNNVKNVCGDAAVHLEDTADNCMIVNNTFDNVLGGWGHIVMFDANTDIIITGNTFRQTDAQIGQNPIMYTSEYKGHIIFTDNLVECEKGKLSFLFPNNAQIENNRFIGCHLTGLWCLKDTIIETNTFKESGGITFNKDSKYDGGYATLNCKISNNVFSSTDGEHCIWFGLDNNWVSYPRKTIIDNNICDKGILVKGPQDSRICNNIIYNGELKIEYGAYGALNTSYFGNIVNGIRQDKDVMKKSEGILSGGYTYYLLLSETGSYYTSTGKIVSSGGSVNYYTPSFEISFHTSTTPEKKIETVIRQMGLKDMFSFSNVRVTYNEKTYSGIKIVNKGTNYAYKLILDDYIHVAKIVDSSEISDVVEWSAISPVYIMKYDKDISLSGVLTAKSFLYIPITTNDKHISTRYEITSAASSSVDKYPYIINVSFVNDLNLSGARLFVEYKTNSLVDDFKVTPCKFTYKAQTWYGFKITCTGDTQHIRCASSLYSGNEVLTNEVSNVVDLSYCTYYYDGLKSGDQTSRPTFVEVGHCFYDTTINKPIWWTGSKWVDATGADV